MCYRAGKCTVCSQVRASYGPEIVQAGAVRGGGGVIEASIFFFLYRGDGVGGWGGWVGWEEWKREGPGPKTDCVLTRFQFCVLVSGRTSARFRFGSPFLSKRLWSVDTVL